MSNIFLTDEEMKYQAETRLFFKKELAQLANEIEKTDRYPREVFEILKPTGSLGALIPKEYGGTNQGAVIASHIQVYDSIIGVSSPKWAKGYGSLS